MSGHGHDPTPGWVPGQPADAHPPTYDAAWAAGAGPAPNPYPPVPGYAAQPVPGGDPILLWIGDIGVSRYSVVTPNGTGPLVGSQWIVRDGSRLEESIPAYAIVLTIVFVLFCLLGLLFLLIKERRMVGYVEVSVRAGNVYHVAQLPVRHPAEVDRVRGMVHQAQSMAYSLGQG